YGDVADVKSYATQAEANLDLISGRVDLVIADSVVLLEGLLNTDDGKNFEFVGPDISDEKWFGEGIGIAIRREDHDLVELLNKAIDQIRADGTYQQINAKYFDVDLFGN
ncbi:MAG: transporter substrate-binding domain-containing protein, partial [Alphaproteobacteria bacterium]